jgi:hypothetical protein
MCQHKTSRKFLSKYLAIRLFSLAHFDLILVTIIDEGKDLVCLLQTTTMFWKPGGYNEYVTCTASLHTWDRYGCT